MTDAEVVRDGAKQASEQLARLLRETLEENDSIVAARRGRSTSVYIAKHEFVDDDGDPIENPHLYIVDGIVDFLDLAERVVAKMLKEAVP